MIIYRCDRCKTEAHWVREVAIRGLSIPPEAQYEKPESYQICVTCWQALKGFMKLVLTSEV